jgi:hypothetical protein
VFGNFDYFRFKDFTHKIVAFDKAWKSRGLLRRSAPMKFEDFFEDSLFGENAAFLAEAKDELIENDRLRKALAEPRAI